MAPQSVGVHQLDSGCSYALVKSVLDFGIKCDNPNITILCKYLQGPNTKGFEPI